MPRPPAARSCAQEVDRFFRTVLSARPGYEDRPQQRAMAAAVARALEDEEILVVEAGTGTGKSLAYLVPALLWRAAGGREPVVVATRTLNLQQQILDHDLPLLHERLPVPFTAVQARGWSNYLCLRRLHSLPGSGELEPHEESRLAALQQAVDRGVPGVRGHLDVPDDMWPRLACDSTACGRQRCPFYERCFLFRERRALEQADLVITNHALLLTDLAMREDGAQGILPSLARVVLDEAHHLEETATEHLGRGFRRSDFFRLLQQLYRPRARLEEGGFLAALRQGLATAPLDPEETRAVLATLDRHVLALVPALAQGTEEMLHGVATGLSGDSEKAPLEPSWFTTEAGVETRAAGLRLAAKLEEAGDALREVKGFLEDLEDWSPARAMEVEVAGFARRLDTVRQGLEFCLYPDSRDWVYWREHSPRDTGLGAVPLDVGLHLSNLLFGTTRTAVLTSATLTVQGSTRFLEERVGLEPHSERVQRLVVSSPFDYASQALLAVARDLPEPGDPSFVARVARPVADLVAGLGGSTFLLATSWRALRDLEAALAPLLAEEGIGVLAQGRADRTVLLQRFRSGGRYLLLGTDSFWEGVDVPGDALRCVVLARLPFRVPTEPVHQARSSRLEEEGHDAFVHYHLPMAVVKFRQGFGRLIRTARDRGVVLLLDSRVTRKRYGRAFLDSLPPCSRQEGRLDDLVDRCLEWLAPGTP